MAHMWFISSNTGPHVSFYVAEATILVSYRYVKNLISFLFPSKLGAISFHT